MTLTSPCTTRTLLRPLLSTATNNITTTTITTTDTATEDRSVQTRPGRSPRPPDSLLRSPIMRHNSFPLVVHRPGNRG